LYWIRKTKFHFAIIDAIAAALLLSGMSVSVVRDEVPAAFVVAQKQIFLLNACE
jgi:tmRNA-binding protein